MSTVTVTIETTEATLPGGSFPFDHYQCDLVTVPGAPGTNSSVNSTTTTAVFDDVPDGRYTVTVYAINTNSGIIGGHQTSSEFATPAGTVDSTYQAPAGVTVVVS